MSLAEMGLIVLVTVIFIGPKELPVVVRTISGWVRQLRALVSEVKKGLESIAQEAELAEIKEAAKSPYIVDLDGQFRETYDISDIMKAGPSATPARHPERSEGSQLAAPKILRSAQDDNGGGAST